MKAIFIVLCFTLVVFAQEHQEEYQNFTVVERIGTMGMNIIPGLGSITIMDDWTGAGIQWALTGAGTVLMTDLLINNKKYTEPHIFIEAMGIYSLFFVKIFFNITRSATYDNPKYVQQTLEKNGSKNFTAEQRFNTFELNIIPGLGSIVIMDDWVGAITQWALAGLVIIPMIETDSPRIDPSVSTVLGYYIFFNIYRSATYNNLKNVTFNECDGFHLSALPNRHGKIMPHLVFSKAF